MLEPGVLMWTGFLIAAFAVAVVVARPLGRSVVRDSAGPSDVDLYRSQMDDLKLDEARGVILPVEAEAARIEIARRMIRSQQAALSQVEDINATRRRRIAGVMTLAIIPAVALAVYGTGGTPSMPAFPLAARQEAANPDVATLLARVEDHLRKNPDDAKGWELLVPVYSRAGRFDEAAAALGHIIRLQGSSADREADLGEVLVAAKQGMVTQEALVAFRKAVSAEAAHPKARFYLAMAAEQEGRVDDARKSLADLLASAPEGAPWRGLIEREMARLAGRNATPESEAAQEIARLDTADQKTAIAGMVAQLANRLKDQPQDFDGWLRLIRAYRVMGEAAGFDEAVSAVRRTFAGDANRMTQLEQFLAALPPGKTP